MKILLHWKVYNDPIFVATYYSIAWIIYPSCCWWTSQCFQVEDTMINSPVFIHVFQCLFQHKVLKLYGKGMNIRVDLLCLGGYICSVLLTKCQQVFYRSCINLHFHQQYETSRWSISWPQLLLIGLFFIHFEQFAVSLWLLHFGFSWFSLDYQCG